MLAPHQIHDGHNQGPEEGGEDPVSQISHHQTWTYYRGEQSLWQREDNKQTAMLWYESS